MSHDHHSHEHHHGHQHGALFHSHAPVGQLRTALVLTFLILAVEVVGGVISNSLALMSDAGHVLTDVGAIGLSWYAMKQSQRPPTERMTFGYYRSGIIAAFVNASALVIIAVVILWEALQRFHAPETIHGPMMIISPAFGLVVNLYMGFRLRDSNDLNIRSAVLHMVSDALASAAVIVGGMAIFFTHWYLIDPLLSMVIAVLIAVGALKIVQQALSILLEGTPKDINPADIADVIKTVGGVVGVHDLHIWSLSAGVNALSCHVVLDGNPTLQETQSIVSRIEHKLLHENILHATIQAEDRNHLHDSSLLCCAPVGNHYH